MGEKVLSVITPMYNSQETICACIQSVLMQSVPDVEAIVVDDGSRDGSVELVQQLAQKDNRVRLFLVPHVGVSSARNYGLDHATGTWVTFLDSDDTLSPDFTRRSLDIVRKEQAVYAILWPFTAVDEQMPVLKTGETACRSVAQMAIPIINGWQSYIGGKLFLRTILQNAGLRFCSGISYAEDTLFAMDYLLQCSPKDRVVMGNFRLYNYTISESGLRLSNPEKTKHLPLLSKQLERFIEMIKLSPAEAARLEAWKQKRIFEVELATAIAYPTAGERFLAISKAMDNKAGRIACTRASGGSFSAYYWLIRLGSPALFFLYQEVRAYVKHYRKRKK